jgi:hypothetical protein
MNAPLGNSGTDIRNVYGLYIEDLQTDGDLAFTNTPYGVYQVGADDLNYFAGTTGFGVDPSSGSRVEVNHAFSGSETDLAGVESELVVSSGSAERNAAVRGSTAVADGTSGLTFVYGVYAEAEAKGDAQVVNLVGVNAEVLPVGTGIIGQIIGFRANAVTGSSANVTNYYGLLVSAPTVPAGGSIGVVHAIDIEGMAVSGVTTPWGIYQRGANDNNYFAGKVGIGTTTLPASVALDVGGTAGTLGAFMVPRMTTVQRVALTGQNGMIVYDTGANRFYFYENGAWVSGSGLA